MSKSTKPEVLTCELCQEKPTLQCSNCLIANYCGRDHLMKHWREGHGASCCPAKIQKVNNVERIVATRDILPGQNVFREKPIVIGPGYLSFYIDPEISQIAICLGCYKRTTVAKLCPMCHWPACSKACANEFWHCNFECEIFHKNKIRFRLDKMYYYSITILRIFLLKQKVPEAWKKLSKKFDYYSKPSKSKGNSERIKEYALRFKHDFKTWNLDYLDMSKMSGVIRTLENYGYSSDMSEDMYAIGLFEFGLKVEHDCVPNSYNKMDRRSGPVEMVTYAVTPIAQGQQISRMIHTSYALKGTFTRREDLFNVLGIECKCSRCADPTELGSYASAMTCPKASICGGYILPTTPLKFGKSTLWKCDRCSHQEYVEHGDLKNRVKRRVASLMNRFQAVETIAALFPEGYEQIGEGQAYMKYASFSLHYNHFYLLVFREALLKDYADLLTRADGVDGVEEEKEFLIGSLWCLARETLLIANSKIMYYLAKACRNLIILRGDAHPDGIKVVDRMEEEAHHILTKYYQNDLMVEDVTKDIVNDLERSITLASYDGIVELFRQE